MLSECRRETARTDGFLGNLSTSNIRLEVLESTPMATPQKKMEYVRLGPSGLKISKIVLGCMSYGYEKWGGNWVLPEEEETKHIKAAYDAGINAFDTANVYPNGLSEEVLGRALKTHNIPREEIVILTKVFYGLSRKHIFDSVQASLRHLQVDYIDVLQCHGFDYNTPIEEAMQALHDIVKAGYVRYIGMSSCYAYQFHAMQNHATNNNLTKFISMQNHYNLVYREEEREMFPTLKQFGVSAIPWSPLARGALTRPLAGQLEGKETARGESDTAMPPSTYTQSLGNQKVIERVEEIATKRGVKMAQIGIAWLLSKEGVSAPIVGTTSLKYLAEAVDAIHIKLTEDEIKYLEEPYQPMPTLGILAQER
ncbi:Aldo-ket-red domain-containing protein [Mycena kentingensis (nom. inval.)]|nr:Aldo-ket-red domain-containing protein [Mycena kentingensis (nom. inval.)]